MRNADPPYILCPFFLFKQIERNPLKNEQRMEILTKR